jgi:tRNA(Arg) A34 adenosine deaminase TadA
VQINDAEQHIIWMERALVLAERSVAAGNHPFGALLVVDKRNILEAALEI